jgi:hypothetical protein
MKLYVSGPMTGIPEWNFPAFQAASDTLRAAGYEVIDPSRHGAGAGTWESYLRRDLVEMLDCDGVALLPGWQGSKGANLEVFVAEALSMPIRNLEEWAANRMAAR